MNGLRRAAVVIGLMAGHGVVAHAAPVITTNLTTLPNTGGNFSAVDLSSVPVGTNGSWTLPNGDTLTVNTDNPELAGVAEGVVSTAYSGNNADCVGSDCYGLSGVYAPPVTNSSGSYYQGKFLSTGDNGGTIALGLGGDRHAVALLWGSVDASNKLTLEENGNIVAAVTGSQVNAMADGSQTFGGSDYVLITDTTAFNEIVLSSGVISFEAADLEIGTTASVPAPAMAPMFGLMLAGLAAWRRRAG